MNFSGVAFNARMDWLRLYGPRLWNSVKHDVKQRYAGSYLGSLWAILYPLCLLTLYSVLYMFIFRIRAPNLSPEGYTVLVIAGLSVVIMFSECLSSGLTIIAGQRQLLMNTVFPAELLPPRSVLASQVPSLAALTMTVIAGSVFGSASWIAIFIVPIVWILLIMFMMGVVWIFSLLALVVRDIQQAVGIITITAMILSPIAYTPEMVPAQLKFVLWFNPLTYFIMSIQAPVALGTWPSPTPLIGSFILGIGVFAMGLAFFRRARFAFVDYA